MVGYLKRYRATPQLPRGSLTPCTSGSRALRFGQKAKKTDNFDQTWDLQLVTVYRKKALNEKISEKPCRILWLKERVTDVRYGLKDDFEEGFLKKTCWL